MAEPGQEVAVGRQERIATLVVAALLAALGISWMVMASRFVPLAQLKPIDLTLVPYWSGAILALTSAFLFLRYWLVPAVPASELNRPPLFELAGQLWVLAALVAFVEEYWIGRPSMARWHYEWLKEAYSTESKFHKPVPFAEGVDNRFADEVEAEHRRGKTV